ncbi:MAG: hypothetical protein SPH80_02745 [Peptoniphilaceae bacterium]|nr:hypothetical protein [Peptoniphilaceae bacterium]
MKRFLSLVRINLKLTPDQFRVKSKKKLGGILLAIFLVIYLMGVFVPLGKTMMESYHQIGADQLFAAMIVSAAMFYQVIMLLITIPAMMFFGKDVEVFLAMPLKPWEIIGAKLAAVVVQAYLLLGFMIVPLIIGSLLVNISVQILIGWILTFLFMPMIPVSISAILMLLLLQIAPFFRSKQHLSYFTGFMAILFSIGMGIIGGSFGGSMGRGTMDFVNMARSGAPLIQSLGYIFPPIIGAQMMIYGKTLLQIIMGLGITVLFSVIYFAVALLISNWLYFPIALNISADSSKSRKMSKEQAHSDVAKKTGILKTLQKREMVNLFRNPTVMMNSVFGTLIVPVVFTGLALFMGFRAVKELGNQGIGISMMQDMIMEIFAEDPTYGWTVAIGAGMFLGMASTTGSIAATAITRDAQHIDFLKTIPVPASQIFIAKLLSALQISGVAIIIPLVVFIVFLPQAYWIVLTALIVGLLTAACISMAELYMDICFPVLDWQTEIQAVKQNKNVMISSLAGTFGIFALAGLAFLLKLSFIIMEMVILGVFVLMGLFFFIRMMKKSDFLLARIGNK